MSLSGFGYQQRNANELRYESLKDCLDEYLCEDSSEGSKAFLDDLQKACHEIAQYHKDSAANLDHVSNFFK